MNYLIILTAIFSLTNLDSVFANSNKLKEPFYVSLLPDNMEHKLELKCSDEQKHYECTSYEEKCEFANEYNENNKSLSFKFDASPIVAEIEYKNSKNNESYFLSDQNIYSVSLGWPSSSKLYVFQKIDVLKRKTIPGVWYDGNPDPINVSVYEISEESFKKVVVIPKNFQNLNLVTKGLSNSVHVFVGTTQIGLTSNNKFKFPMGPGQYTLNFEYSTEGDVTKFATKEVIVPTDKDIEVSISESDFVDKHQPIPDFSFNELYGKFSPPFSDQIHSEIIKIEELKVIGQKEVDITNYIEMFNYGPRVKADKRNEFKQMFAQWNPTRVSIKGICKKEELKVVTHEINIFAEPKLTSSSIGKIVLAVEKGSLNGFYVNTKMLSVPFQPNLVSTFCESDDKNIFYHQVFEYREDWSNLGNGPWGHSGWIQIKAEPVVGSNIYFLNEKLGHSRATYSRDNTGTYRKNVRGDGDSEVIKLEDIVYPDGKLRGKVDCEPGC